LRTVAGEPQARRPSPAEGLPEPQLHEVQRRQSAALMRVNHCGEVCAQALYQGQALASKNRGLKATLSQAADEEQDHLAWSQRRIRELGGRTSVLNPLWYGGSLAIGFLAGKLGDRWNLGFLAETEHQVERHLQGHLGRVDPGDVPTRTVIEAMKRDEAGHARTAIGYGARALPAPVRRGMAAAARVMTSASYWV
jgi:ubiquinone biosynthesis monooxygenase Coq7